MQVHEDVQFSGNAAPLVWGSLRLAPTSVLRASCLTLEIRNLDVMRQKIRGKRKGRQSIQGIVRAGGCPAVVA